MKIKGKRVLLTGANGGIGAAIAQALKAEGANLVLSGRQEGPLRQMAEMLGDAQYHVADLTQDDDLANLVSNVGPIDILVANAGLPGTDDITAYTVAQIDACLDVNLRAPMLLARALLPGMVERGEGQLVFISSVAGKVASPMSSLYSASKFGLRGFAECLRQDLHSTGVGVSTIYPGVIHDAGMYANSGAAVPFGAPTNTTTDVAQAVVKAIKHNRAAIDVTGWVIKLGIHLAHVSPALNGFLQRLVNAREVAQSFAQGHRRRQSSRRD